MKLSVVLPAYNCAETIGATLDSLLNQTFSDFEVLAVDDGSSDRTPALLADYAARDARVRVITLENGGPARARNRGMEEAVGDYLCFLDGDDLLCPDAYERLVALADRHSLDCAVCGYTMEHIGRGRTHRREFNFPSFVAERPGEFRERVTGLTQAHLMYVVWNKCWRLDFLRKQGLRFADCKSGEDRLFNIRALAYYRRFGCVDEPLYRYRIRGSGGLANRYISDRLESALECHRALCAAYEEMGLFAGETAGAEREAVELQFLKQALACLTQLYAPDCPLSRGEKRTRIQEILDQPALREALAGTPHSRGGAAAARAVLRGGRVAQIAGMARAIRFAQTRLHPLYLQLKHRG